MAPETAGARRASAASRVDLAHDALAPERGVFRFDYAAGEFMARHAAILHVAAGDLQVGAADAGDRDADDTLAPRRYRIGIVGAKFQIAINTSARIAHDSSETHRRFAGVSRGDPCTQY